MFACTEKSTAPSTPPTESVATIALSPSSATLVAGDTLRLVALLRSASGVVLTNRILQWSSSEPATATVTGTGLVTGIVAGGPVSITASSEGITATAMVTVTRAPVASIELTPTSARIQAGGTTQLLATLRSSRGDVLTDRTTTWSSSNPAVATVSPVGVVSAIRVGDPVTISAASEGIVASAQISVIAPISESLVYRWTFSEEGGPGTIFRDDVRGAQAAIVRVGSLSGSAIGGQATLTGGARNNADYIALPGGLLRGQTDATIEVWATLHSLKFWSRVFDVGSSAANNLFIAWSQGVSSNADRTGFAVNGVENRADNRLAPFTIDLQHHIVLTIDEGGGDGGKTRLSLHLDGEPRGSFDTFYRLQDLIDNDFWLGRSHYGDETANASYDEIRIHNRAFSAVDVQQSFVAGPVRSGTTASISILPPSGIADTVRGVGVKFNLRAVGKDQLGRQFPLAGAQWSSSNAVATVDNAGLVTTHSVGELEIRVSVAGATAQWRSDVVRIRRVAVDPYLATPIAGAVWEIPVVLIEYLPTADGSLLDVKRAPDYWSLNPLSLDSSQALVLRYAKRRKMSSEEGSRFRGYKDAAATPSLGYRVVEHLIVYDQIPPHPTKRQMAIPGNPRFEDWHAVFQDLQLEPLMRSRAVRELWVAWTGFDGNFPSYDPAIHKVEDMRAGWESNMSSPTTGDISNSDRDPADAPVLSHTYIIYGIATRRTQAEAVHNVGHQMEAMMSYVAWRQDGNDRLFWRDFVGHVSGAVFGTGRAGWTHMPPNTSGHYDYLNPALVASDIEDWRPNNSGQKKAVNVDTWGKLNYPWPGDSEFPQRVESQWYLYWFQNFPGLGNQIPHGSRWMTNWWAFVGNWDAAITSGLGLHGTTPAATRGSGQSYRYAAPRIMPRPVVHRPPARR